MSKVYVFGHKNPDNDAIMSAVVLTQLLNQVKFDGNEYVTRRLGPLPAESAKLLAETGTPEPELLEKIEPAAEGAEQQKVVLCDHNEQVIGVVDHHRIGDFETAAPLCYICLPWGSSCTIVRRLFDLLGQVPTKEQTKLLLSAMMTDTLMLKSPTTTDQERELAPAMGAELGVDPIKFGMDVFLSRPSGSFTAQQMVANDTKQFEVGDKKLLIGQYETVDKTRALGMIPEIREAMRAYQAEKGADGMVLCVTDIMEEGSQVLFEGDTDVAQKGLGIANEQGGVWMPGVLSRKKQVAAPILAAAE